MIVYFDQMAGASHVAGGAVEGDLYHDKRLPVPTMACLRYQLLYYVYHLFGIVADSQQLEVLFGDIAVGQGFLSQPLQKALPESSN